ncbi:MAG: MFS transporter [Dehalococcoidales bacterium]|nr:MFS transporter [Dehalococcoidales bacterium]
MKISYGWIIVTCSLIILVALGTLTGTFSIFLEPLANQFQWERGALSAAFSICTFLGGLFAIVTGKLTDRYGPRLLVTITGILTGIVMLCMAEVNALWQVYLLWGVLGAVAMSCCIVPVSSTIPRWFNTKRGLAISLGIIGMALGGAIWPVLAQWMINSFDWQQAFRIMGIVAFAGIIIPAQFLKLSPTQIETHHDIATEKPAIAAEGLTLRQSAKTARFWIFGIILLLHNFYIMTILVHLVPYARDIGITPITAASALSVFIVVSLAAQLVAAFVVDKLGGVRVLFFSLIAAMLSLLLLPFTVSTGLLFLFAIILGVTGAMHTLQMIVSVEMFGTKYIGSVLGVVLFFGTLGGALGPLFAGGIYDMAGSYMPAFITCSCLGVTVFILSLVLLRVVKGRK